MSCAFSNMNINRYPAVPGEPSTDLLEGQCYGDPKKRKLSRARFERAAEFSEVKIRILAGFFRKPLLAALDPHIPV